MWRWGKSASRLGDEAPEKQDSDQSISEEEEEGDCAGSAISAVRVGDKGGMQVLSQLERLRDSYELRLTEEEAISSQERKGGCLVDDEIENPLFFGGGSSNRSPNTSTAAICHANEGTVCLPTVASISHLDEELISDDEEISSPILGSARENSDGTWSEANQAVEALVWLTENSTHSSSHGAFVKENKSYKGADDQTKCKHKFIFRSHSHTRGLSLVFSNWNGSITSKNISPTDEIGATVEVDSSKFMAESKLINHNNESNQPEKNTVPSELGRKHDNGEHPVTEFLDCFNDITRRGRRVRMVLNRNEPPLSDRNLEDDELPKALDSPFCTDNEENPQSLKAILPRRSMIDQFHDVFGMASVIDDKSYSAFHGLSCSGIYQKLQKVMRSEKDRDMDYLKSIGAETSFKDEKMCIYMRILSRSMEAKLIVCSCTSVEDGKNSYRENNWRLRTQDGATTLTVIFNPRVCGDVELEVGNLICIHQPWIEVQAKGKDEVILLCSYFSPSQR